MGDTPVCTIDSAGIHKPPLGDCLAHFVGKYQGIYGSDLELDSSTQDGESTGLLGSALDDVNAMCVDAYNAYRPGGAQGAGLASIVKINGITKQVPSYSNVPIACGGVFGLSVPAGGLVTDEAGNQWALASGFTFPNSGTITLSATCLTIGAVALSSGSTLTIKTQTRGWQTAVAAANATPGAPVESDAALRVRQAKSTSLPALTVTDNMVGAISQLPGVARIMPYANSGNTPDSNGIPGHCISMVVDGGDAATIANTIFIKLGQGVGTYGTTVESVLDKYGIAHDVAFFYVSEPVITWALTITPLANWNSSTIALIQKALADFTNAYPIGCGGVGIEYTRAYSAAYLGPSIAAAAQALQAAIATNDPVQIQAASAAFVTINAAANSYKITSLAVARDGGTPASTDVTIAFNEAPSCVPDGVTVTP